MIIMVGNHNEEHWCCMVFFDLFCVFFGTGENKVCSLFPIYTIIYISSSSLETVVGPVGNDQTVSNLFKIFPNQAV